MKHSISCDPTDSSGVAAAKAALRLTSLDIRTIAARGAAESVSRSGEPWQARLLKKLDALSPACVGFYWPIRDEPDLRGAISAWLAAQANRTAALPLVTNKHEPLQFHRWTAATSMRTGRHGIAIPEHMGADTLCEPDLLLVPCVGFTTEGFRLGYGGGFYDRTLASRSGETLKKPRPLALGIAWEATRIDSSIMPVETHDIPLDGILTETGGYGIAA